MTHIEQAAQRFIGTELSTFTGYIHRLRGYMAADVAPDKNIYYTTDANTGYAPYLGCHPAN
jgi:hypothetical protein